MPLLELRAITKEFPGVRALDGVSFDLEPGEIHALCGENGAGKSTLIKILCGVHPAGSYGGEVRLRGEAVHFRGLPGSAARGIALIAQELALVPNLSVAENLLLGREPRRFGLVRWDEVRDEARRALDRVGLDVPVETPVRELGIGQQQLVEIARALRKDAAILVLDEPTAALPDADARRLLALLGELRKKGVAMIYVSHRLRRGLRRRRPDHRAARRPLGRHGAAGGDVAREGDLPDGRPRDQSGVSPLRAAGRATSSCASATGRWPIRRTRGAGWWTASPSTCGPGRSSASAG